MEIENNANIEKLEKKSNKKRFVAIAILLVAAGVGSYFMPGKLNIWSKLNIAALGNVAAIVNGDKITKNDLDARIDKVKDIAQVQGVNLKDEKVLADVKKQVLADMVSEKLLLQNAKKSGITATDNEIKNAYDELVAKFKNKEEFDKEMTSRKMTEAELKDGIGKQMILNKYISQNVDIKTVSATDSEINSLYKNYSDKQKNMPNLEEIKPQLIDQVKQQKYKELVFNFIEKLKTEANIKIIFQ